MQYFYMVFVFTFVQNYVGIIPRSRQFSSENYLIILFRKIATNSDLPTSDGEFE